MIYIINTELFKLKQMKLNFIIIVIKFDIYYILGFDNIFVFHFLSHLLCLINKKTLYTINITLVFIII